MKKFFALAAGLLAFTACTDYLDELDDKFDKYQEGHVIKDGKFKDSRDGKVYRVVEIDGDLWFAENLRYVDSSATKNLRGNVWCYDNNKDNCEKYGPLYSWYAAMDKDPETYSGLYCYGCSGICPDGWRLPSESDWSSLAKYVDQKNAAEGVGTSLKSTADWQNEYGVHDGVNRFGFNALPAGRRNADDDGFLENHKYAFFWTSNDISSIKANAFTLISANDTIDIGEYYKDHGMSIRCVTSGYNFELDTTKNFVPDPVPELDFGYDSVYHEGRYYKYVTIEGRDWFAENLAVDMEGSYCYKDNADTCKKYGRLYTYEAAVKACPEGWSIPDYSDVSYLRNYMGWFYRYGRDDGWEGITNDAYGFKLLPAGGFDGVHYYDLGRSAYFWMYGGVSAFIDNAGDFTEHQEPVGTAVSVRCSRYNPEYYW